MNISSKFIIKAMAVILTAALPILSYSQKQVQKIFFPQTDYDIYGNNDHNALTVVFTDNTIEYNKIKVTEAIITGLDTAKLGIQNFTVEYRGVKQICTALITNMNYHSTNDSLFALIMKQNGISADKKHEYFDSHENFIWINKPDSIKVWAQDLEYYLGYDQQLEFMATEYGFNGINDIFYHSIKANFDKPGVQDYSFKNTTVKVNVIGIDSIMNLPSKLYPFADYTNIKLKVLYTNGKEKEIKLDKKMLQELSPDKSGKQKISVTIGNKTQIFEADIPTIKTILSTMGTFYRGRGIDGNYIKVNYSDGNFKSIPMEYTTITSFDTNKSGKQSINIQYAGKSLTTDINVVDIDSVYINDHKREFYTDRSKPTQYISEWALGRYYLSKFEVKYADGTHESIDANHATITGFDINTPGKKNVTIEYAGKTINTIVNIYRIPTKFDFSEIPDTIFQFEDIKGNIKAIYEDGASEYIDIQDTYNHFGDYYYKTNIGTFTPSFYWHGHEESPTITIVPNTKKPKKFDFSDVKTDIYDYADLSGNIKVIYADGSYDKFDITLTDYTLDSKTTGKKNINVSWHGLTAPLIVNIKPDPDKPAQKDGIYQIESKAALMWYIRYVRVIGTQGNDAAISTKLLLSENLLDKKETYQQYVSIFSVSATIKGFTQSQNSKNGLFTQKQTEIIKSVPLGGKIYIEDFKVKTLDGKEVQAQALKLETN